MVKHLPKALLLALLVGTPALAQPLWIYYKNQYLGPNRVFLMSSCNMGRANNLRGVSYFNRIARDAMFDIHTKQGMTPDQAIAFLSGEAAAMGIVCPNVW